MLLPVDRLVTLGMSPALEASIREASGEGRVQALREQFSTGLQFTRVAMGLFGLWWIALGGLWPTFMRWRGSPSSTLNSHSDTGRCGPNVWIPIAAYGLSLMLAVPLLDKGFEHEELLVHEMLARRGPLAAMAAQNLPPRAAQPGYTIIESLVVRAFGEAEWIARLPALLLGAAVMFPLFGIACRLKDRRFAGLACGLLLITPFYHYYITYARGYPLGLAAFWSGVWACLNAIDNGRWRDWLLTGGCLFIACYSHLALGLSTAFLSLAAVGYLGWRTANNALLAPEKRLPVFLADCVPPVVVLGTTALLLGVAYAPGIPTELQYLATFGTTDYYTAYHVNSRFLRVLAIAWSPYRGYQALVWGQLLLAAIGTIILFANPKRRWPAVAILLPCLGPALLLALMRHFVYPRFFLFYLPAYVIVTAMALDTPARAAAYAGFPRRIGMILLGLLLVLPAIPGFRYLYRIERCGVRAAVEDATFLMNDTDRLGSILDAYITVRHYHPETVSMYSDAEFWSVLQGDNPPLFVINVPYLDMDIPGGHAALQKRYRRFRTYPSWIDIDADHETVYLYRLRNP